jgi:hypothetical protein
MNQFIPWIIKTFDYEKKKHTELPPPSLENTAEKKNQPRRKARNSCGCYW